MCGRREIQSGPLINTGYEINRRIVFVEKAVKEEKEKKLNMEDLRIIWRFRAMDRGKSVVILKDKEGAHGESH